MWIVCNNIFISNSVGGYVFSSRHSPPPFPLGGPKADRIHMKVKDPIPSHCDILYNLYVRYCQSI